MPKEPSKLRIKERVTLRKFEGNPEDGELVETVHIEDGRIVERELHGIERKNEQEPRCR